MEFGLHEFSQPKSEYITIVIHHEGHFVYTPRMRYISRRVNYFDFCHVEAMSMIEVNDMVNELWFEGLLNCFWKSS